MGNTKKKKTIKKRQAGRTRDEAKFDSLSRMCVCPRVHGTHSYYTIVSRGPLGERFVSAFKTLPDLGHTRARVY